MPRSQAIEIAIDPLIAQAGPLAIRWWGVFLIVSMLVSLALALREARRRGIREDDIWSFSFWAILAGFLGARLVHLLDSWPQYAGDWRQAFLITEGGLALYGAILGGLVAAGVFAWAKDLPFWRLADTLAPAAALGQAVGRLGSIISGESFGRPAALPFSLVYTHERTAVPDYTESLVQVRGVPTHPAAGYELLWDLAIFGILWSARRRLPEGIPALLYVMLYGVGRFVISFARLEPAFVLSLSAAQVIALSSLAVVLPLLARRLLRQRARAPAVPPSGRAGMAGQASPTIG